MGAELIQLRRALHRHPEISCQEVQTAKRIVAFLRKYAPNEILENLGGTGVAAVYNFSEDGPAIFIRCELDALPIQEINQFEHRSKFQGVSHKCGHDGHMAIVAGLAEWLEKQSFQKGKVILLFQPAEENGQGAAAVLKDSRFKSIQPDYVFSLHNIPGFPMHQIIWVKDQFSASVRSVAISFFGKESHASEPENGISPALAIAELIQLFEDFTINDVARKDFALITPICITMGKKEYGIAAGYGELHLTVRTWTQEKMTELLRFLNESLERVSKEHHLQYKTEWFDIFPTTVNDDFCNNLINKAIEENQLDGMEKPHPFKFGEDFGWFTQNRPGAMFGLGAGENTPALHNPDYDFPDEIIDTGMKAFKGIIEQLLK